MTQILNIKDCLPIIRAAFDEGRLGAQVGETSCLYEYRSGARCAVGVCLTSETISRIRSALKLGDVVQNLRGIVDFSDMETRRMLVNLQIAHDAWCHDEGGSSETFNQQLMNCESRFSQIA